MNTTEIYDGGYSDEQRELDQAAYKAKAKADTKAETDKATAKQVVLDRLGITADEAALLLG
jgi:hypothetical protein